MAPIEDDDESPSSPAPGSERAFQALKAFAQEAREDCFVPLPETHSTVDVRWQIYSTWMLLLCVHHAEAEGMRCINAGWTPRRWVTEAQALRHLYLHSRTLRVLCGLLRWLRWAHLESCNLEGQEDFDEGVGDGRYARTRRRMQDQCVFSGPLQPALALHPDGPLQHRDLYDPQDLEDEECLLRRVLRALRRGDLRGAMKTCVECGQPWRTAFLQGMLPFSEHEGEEEVGYEVDAAGDEADLASIKERHTDWIEVGVVGRKGTSDGNPWRRIWKEQCWDTVDRHLAKPSSPMSATELGIYGFCAGRLDALMPSCTKSWADALWARLHCLKESLVERLLDACGAEFCAEGYFLGEGDCGVPDPTESEASRSARREKLAGMLRGHTSVEDIEAAARKEFDEILRLCATAHDADSRRSAKFFILQAELARSALNPSEGGEQALHIMREWIAKGLGPADGAEPMPCPYGVKRFVSHLAIWQKECLKEFAEAPEVQIFGRGSVPVVQSRAIGVVASAFTDQDIDHFLCEFVGDLVSAASRKWQEQSIPRDTIGLIAEHVSAMTPECRLDAWADLILRLGASGREGDDPCHYDRLRLQVLELCLHVFWGKFQRDAPNLLPVLNNRALRLQSTDDQEEFQDIGPTGVVRGIRTSDVVMVLHCANYFWIMARDRVQRGTDYRAAALSLQELKQGRHISGDEAERAMSVEPGLFLHSLLTSVVVPVLCDAWLTLSARDPLTASGELSQLEGSQVWGDAFSADVPGAIALKELEWFARLCTKYEAWRECSLVEEAARVRAPISRCLLGGFGAAPHDTEQQYKAPWLRDELLDFARPVLAQDRALLEPIPNAGTMLEAPHRQRLCSTLATRAVLTLLDVFQGTGDLDGAMGDLVVAVARSPWLLSRIEPRHARVFLQRLAYVPTRSVDPRLNAAAGALVPAAMR